MFEDSGGFEDGITLAMALAGGEWFAVAEWLCHEDAGWVLWRWEIGSVARVRSSFSWSF